MSDEEDKIFQDFFMNCNDDADPIVLENLRSQILKLIEEINMREKIIDEYFAPASEDEYVII